LLTFSGLACFFTFMTVAEGGGKRAVQKKFQDIYVPALKANWIVWPAVQMINFRIMPIQYQIVSTLYEYKFSVLTILPALCLYDWYCVDSIPLPHKLRRRSNIIDASRIPTYLCGHSVCSKRTWAWLWHGGVSYELRSRLVLASEVFGIGVQVLHCVVSVDCVLFESELLYCVYSLSKSQRMLSLLYLQVQSQA
jgi:hypothetical protein